MAPMGRSRTFRFTPLRMLAFLMFPALLLGGAFIADGSVLAGSIIVGVAAVAIAANLAVGALATMLGRPARGHTEPAGRPARR